MCLANAGTTKTVFMKRLVLLLLIGFLAVTIGCIRKKPKQEQATCGVQTQPTCGDATNVGPTAYFKAKCAACHQFDQNATGPALQGMMKRVPGKEWLMSYLKNEDSLIRSGDTTALRISKQSPVGPSHHFSDLNDRFLDELIRFTEQE
jgi:cytochrome c551/c552